MTDIIRERSVPAKSEAVIPSSEKGIARFQLEKRILGRRTAGNRRSGSEMRRRHIANDVDVVRVAGTSGEVQHNVSRNMGSRATMEFLFLVCQTREVSFQTAQVLRTGLLLLELARNSRWAIVPQGNLVVGIQIGAPVTNFYGALVLHRS